MSVTKLLDQDFVASRAINIYVRNADGNDSNSGTSTNPLATVAEAIRRIPRFVEYPVIVHIGVHAGSGYPWSYLRGLRQRANIYFIGDGAGVGDGKNVLLATGTIGVGSTRDLFVTSGLTPAAYRGKTIEFLTGALSGHRRTINENTATDITPIYSTGSIPANGDTYQIFEPSVELAFPWLNEPNISGDGQKEYGIYFVNLKISNAYGPTFEASDGKVVLCGVEFEGDPYYGAYFGGTSNVELGRDGIDYFSGPPYVRVIPPYNDLGVVSTDAWVGWGVYIASGTLHVANTHGRLNGFLAVNGKVQLYVGASVIIYGGRFDRFLSNYLSASGDGFSQVSAYHELHGGGVELTGLILTNNTTSDPTILVDSSIVHVNRVNFTGLGDGLVVKGDRGFSNIHRMYGSVSGILERADYGGKIRHDYPISAVGGDGDFQVGSGPIHNFSELVSGSQFVDVASLSAIRWYA